METITSQGFLKYEKPRSTKPVVRKGRQGMTILSAAKKMLGGVEAYDVYKRNGTVVLVANPEGSYKLTGNTIASGPFSDWAVTEGAEMVAEPATFDGKPAIVLKKPA